jgi:predicted nucleic acid-binding protein
VYKRQFLEHAFKIATATSLTIYDSLYIASANKLATSDIKLAEVAKQYGRKIVLV